MCSHYCNFFTFTFTFTTGWLGVQAELQHVLVFVRHTEVAHLIAD